MTYRITSQRISEAIAEAISIIPPDIYELIKHVHFFTEDPYFCGVTTFDKTEAEDGRSYKDIMHVLYSTDWSYDKHTTIVIPYSHPTTAPFLIVHELGHVLDEVLGFRYNLEPITDYANTNRREAFAEAFVGYLYWYGKQPLNQETQALFEGLDLDYES